MIGTLESIQLDLMLVLSGISAATAIFMALSKSLDRERKIFLILTNVCAVLLLFFDRLAYIYRGDVSETGYWMVRISNFVVYAMVLLIVWAFNHYIRDIYSDETGFKKIPLRLKLPRYRRIGRITFSFSLCKSAWNGSDVLFRRLGGAFGCV